MWWEADAHTRQKMNLQTTYVMLQNTINIFIFNI
jgi:hypothetical protein